MVHTECLDPYNNLAVEEYLMDHVTEWGPILYFWRANDAVVIGKNQNPWKEVHVPFVTAEGCFLVRRLSGGGAVYHDPGNLNYSLLLPRKQYDTKRQFSALIQALSSLGITVEMMGKNSLAVDGKKISGNAFCLRRAAAMHHGTILISTDLERMRHCLRADESGIQTRAVRSQPAPVMNLSEIDSAISQKQVIAAITESFAEMLDSKPLKMPDDMADGRVIQQLSEKYMSWDWNYGLTPSFSINIRKPLNRFEVEVTGYVEKGIAKKLYVVIRDDNTVLAETKLTDIWFEREALIERFQALSTALGEGTPGKLADLALSA